MSLPVGRETALEENRDQPDDADRARELRVVEVDPAQSLRAEDHAEPEERDEERHAQAPRSHRREHRQGEHAAGDQDLVPDDERERHYEAGSASSTCAACVSGFTRRMIFATLPSASITNVERSNVRLPSRLTP